MKEAHEIVLQLSPAQEDWLVARMALSGMGVLAGLTAEQIGDLQTAANECCDCLSHQPVLPRRLTMRAHTEEKGLRFSFAAEGDAGRGEAEALSVEIARGVLETLLPEVHLEADERGVTCIRGFMAE